MEVVYIVSCTLLLLTVTASPEIPTKGKHVHVGDKSQTALEEADMPRFAEPLANVTVSVGRDALLACVVENLKGYKVAWVRVDTQTILSIHHNVISQNSRISLTYNDHRSWYLHIKEVEESDRGWYMCQVNTDPMRSRKGYLQVVVPPMILEGITSNDLVVREGLNVTLVCKARGYPEPYVMWRREDGEEMLIGGEHVNVVDGELLHITKVSRLHMAAYLCVASNGVPPSISKRVHLRVQFPPMLSIPNQLEGAYIGQDVVLECHTEAYPASINYWTTERGDMIISDTSRAGDKYETTSTVQGYTKYMKLKIRNVGPNDFGTYRCVAKNSLGETDGNIKLDEMPAPTTTILSEMAMLNRSLDGKPRNNKNTLDSNSLPDYGVEEWRDGAGNAGDNNQAPMRNPPDAFHNSAAALAQNNLVGIIIQAIKMQSLGIFKRLTNLIQTINECHTTTATTTTTTTTTTACQINDNIKTTALAAIRPTIPITIRETIQKYVHKIHKLTIMLATSLEEIIKSTVFILRKQREQQYQLQYNSKARQLNIENEFKHVSTQERTTHTTTSSSSSGSSSQHYEKYCKIRYRKLRTKRLCSAPDKTFIVFNTQQSLQDNSNFIEYTHVKDFNKHIKQQEILHKFNTIYIKHIFNKITKDGKNNNHNRNKYNIDFNPNTLYYFITLLLAVTSIALVKKFLIQSTVNPVKVLTNTYTNYLNHQLLVLLLNISCVISIVLEILTSIYSKFNLYAQNTPPPLHTTATRPTTATSLSLTASSFTSNSLTLSSCYSLLFCR